MQRGLMGGAAVLLAVFAFAAPAVADDTDYPLQRPTSTSAPSASTDAVDVKGVKQENSGGLPHTGGSLAPLWGGLGLLAGGGAIVAFSRRRRIQD